MDSQPNGGSLHPTSASAGSASAWTSFQQHCRAHANEWSPSLLEEARGCTSTPRPTIASAWTSFQQRSRARTVSARFGSTQIGSAYRGPWLAPLSPEGRNDE